MTRDTPIDVAQMLTEVGVDASTASPAASVGESRFLRSERSVEMIPQYEPASSDVSLDSKIGEGETTEVFLGTQHSMRRTVAVRKVHPHRRTPAAPGYVLSEAWMLGAFEHPNILPVYAVSKDNEGLPLVLMKAIETVAWTEVLQTPEHVLGCPSHAEPLAFNVQRIIAICSALEHAHHRGCVHRDVKPDNVLIGRDGTVYLHGWELAVSLKEDPSGRFPPAAEQTQIAGTPSYMAPELASRTASQLAPTTDVYLVGATLHEVVTGEPRHVGENVFDAFYSAVASEPVEYGRDVPRELAVILNKAMAADPGDRFQTMTELRHALESFLRHRPSQRLAKRAKQIHQEFERAIATGADGIVVRELFASASTSYGSARHFWPRNPEVVASLDALIGEMIGYELDHGDVEQGRALLGRLHTPSPDLERHVANARELPTTPRNIEPTATVENMDKIERTELPHDARNRITFMSIMVALWSAYGFAFAVMETFAGIPITSAIMAVVAGVGWAILGAFVAARSRSLFKAFAVRHVVGPIGVIAAASAALLMTRDLNQTPHELVVAHFMVFFVAMAMLNVSFDWRLVVSSAVYLLAYVVGSWVPEYAFWIMGVANLVGLGFAGYIIHVRLTESA